MQWYQNDKSVKPHAEPLVQVLEVSTSTPHTTVYTCVARNFTANVNQNVTAIITVIVQGINLYMLWIIINIIMYL